MQKGTAGWGLGLGVQGSYPCAAAWRLAGCAADVQQPPLWHRSSRRACGESSSRTEMSDCICVCACSRGNPLA